jgi:hypothetical protein
MLLIVLKGKGTLRPGGAAVLAGETWLLPGAASRWDWFDEGNGYEFLIAKLPTRAMPSRGT